MLRIPRSEDMNNNEVLKRMGTTRKMLLTTRKRAEILGKHNDICFVT